MQQALRPYVTTGIAVASTGIIALVPAAPQLPGHQVSHTQHPDVSLAAGGSDLFAPYADLFSNTSDNLQLLGENAADSSLLTQILTNPDDSLANLPNIVHLFTNVVPDIDVDFSSLPGQASVDIPPMLTLLLAEIGPWVNVFNAAQDVFTQIFDFSDPSAALAALVDAPATLLNAYLNGQDGIDVLGMHIPIFNGLLVPEQSVDTDLNVGQLVDTLGFGDQSLTGLLDGFGLGDKSVASLATSLLDGLGYGDKTPVDLLDQLGFGDQSVGSLASSLLDGLGYGDKTPVDLLDQLGFGDQSVADLAKDLLEQLGVDNPSITDLAGDAGVGDEKVSTLLAGLLDSAGYDDPTITDLVEQLGYGDTTVAGLATQLIGDPTIADLADQAGLSDTSIGDLATSLLDSAGYGDKTLPEVLEPLLDDQFGDDLDTSFGDFLKDVLDSQDLDLTLSEAVDKFGFGDTTLEDLVDTLGVGQEPVTQLLSDAGFGDQEVCDLAGVGGFLCGIAGLNGTTVNDLLGPNTLDETLENLHGGGSGIGGVPADTALADVTVGQLVAATGEGDEHLSTIIDNLGLTNTLGDIFDNLGLGDVDLDTAIVDGFGLDNVTVGDLLGDLNLDNLDLSTVLDRLGLDDVTLVSLLSDLNLDNLDLDTVLDRVLGDTTVNDVLGDLGQDDVHLNDVLDHLLGNVNIDSILGDIGLDDVHLDDVVNNLLGDVNVDDVLSDIGLDDVNLGDVVTNLLGDLNVDTLLNNLGLDDVDVNSLLDGLGLSDSGLLDIHIGDFSGLLPDLTHGFPEQIAEALGA
jgi:hypothetical protein